MKNKKNSQPAKKKRNLNAVSGIDWMLVLIVVVLLIFGLIMLYSASSYNSQIKFGTSAWYVKKQIFSTLIGLVGMFVIAFVPINFWRKAAIPLYILGVLSVLLILTPLGGEEINGAKRWLDLKVISVQPAEILKVALVAAMAFFIAKFIKYLDDW
ncbi:MAG: FtsW/RodA/SpoVE family cell cycle protein, partial [Lachnospiraceae bacterium]|nr:FtsW/RodA/SpoVE family cell cycle protein [Lachnospiraceae bacterium]